MENTHGQCQCSDNCCSANYAFGVTSEASSRPAETACPHEIEGVHPPVKKDPYLDSNQFTAFCSEVIMYESVPNFYTE